MYAVDDEILIYHLLKILTYEIRRVEVPIQAHLLDRRDSKIASPGIFPPPCDRDKSQLLSS